ncbi:3-oxoadipate enol-lactonase 2 [Amycolatopsis sp. CA-230715]|nr:3-oxoadipate enol-lactonase [Amycolatopsis sp. CA-230715]QWF78249.1 3-oxoadipate enol-lactonase 2 [Amycolatopsis sp. CA-230715]
MSLYYVEDGPSDGVPVVLSGSIGSDHRMWEPQVKPLAARGFRVIRPDHPGHGKSPVPVGPCSIADVVEGLLGLLDDLGVAKAHLVGLSLGGMAGMWLGAHRPDRITSLTLCCTSAKLGPPERWAERAATVLAEGTGAVADAAVGRWVTPAYAERNPETVAMLRAMVAGTPAAGYAACCAAIEHMDLTGDLPRIAVPTLVISGAEDPATPPDHGELIADGIPGARFEIVEGAAHLGSYEQHERFTALILDRVGA